MADIQRFGRFGIAVLQPMGGEAVLADAAGRSEIWIHGGPKSPDGRLRATNGSLRIANEDQFELMKALAGKEGLECECFSVDHNEYGEMVSCDVVVNYGDPPALAFQQLAALAAPFAFMAPAPRGALLFLGEYDSGTYFTNVDLDVLANNETSPDQPWNEGYVPTNSDGEVIGNSGVTLVDGLDLGQQSVSDLKAMGVPQGIINILTPYLGLQGEAALDYLDAHPLTLTDAQADTLNADATTYYFNQTGENYDKASPYFDMSDLPWQGQTVLCDQAWWHGQTGVQSTAFWKDMSAGNWDAAYNDLIAAGGNRNNYDASILLQAINANTLPKK
jgi:hypothetical protein